jgi:hypothetical protein
MSKTTTSKTQKRDDSDPGLRSRAREILDRRRSLGDDVVLFEAAQRLASVALQFLEDDRTDVDASRARERKLVAAAEIMLEEFG